VQGSLQSSPLKVKRQTMPGPDATYCTICRSANRGEFTGEIAIHFRGPKDLEKPIVWVFPKIVVCLDCGIAQFAVPETELRVLSKRDDPAR